MTTYSTPLDILEFPRLTLFTQAPGTERDRSSFGFSLMNGGPRFTTWTRVDDKEKGPIAAGIGIEALKAVIIEARRVWSLEKPIQDISAIDTLKRDEESATFDKVVSSTLVIGRDQDGICFIGLKSADTSRPEIIFHFKGLEYHPFRRKSGPIPEDEMSAIHANGWLSALEAIVNANVKGQTPEERKAQSERWKAQREARKGGSKGGYNNNNNFQSQSTPSKAPSDSDFLDTISF